MKKIVTLTLALMLILTALTAGELAAGHGYGCGRGYLNADGNGVCDWYAAGTRCACGGIIKPDVVLYEEGLDQRLLQKAVAYIARADVLIVGGTSLVVYPAAGLIDYYRGNKLVLINRSATSRDSQADLVINDSIGQVLAAVTGEA